MKYWYAIHCSSGDEEKVRKRFDCLFQNYYSFFPKRILRERRQGDEHIVQKPLFSGYFFFSSSENLFYYQSIELIRKLNQNGVNSPAFGVLGMNKNSDSKISRSARGDMQVKAVNEEEIDFLLQLTGKDEIIQPSIFYKEGKAIKIARGALKGHEGILLKFDKRKGRAKILLPFLGQKREVDVAAELLA